jgi:hypothetical protein
MGMYDEEYVEDLVRQEAEEKRKWHTEVGRWGLWLDAQEQDFYAKLIYIILLKTLGYKCDPEQLAINIRDTYKELEADD